MRVSYKWLKELVNIEDLTPQALVHDLSLHSTEVETLTRISEATGVVVGYVESCVNHPNSDHLHVCMVNIGTDVLQIVCGAPNVAVGQKVMVALAGAELPGDVKIKKSVIREVESNGMICSLKEIGIENKFIPEAYQNGIYVLDKDAPLGANALEYLGYNDYVIDLDLTPNRMDLLSMLGVARDVNAMYNSGLEPLTYNLKGSTQKAEDEISLRLDTPDCYTYHAKIAKNVVIRESPQFIKSRLMAAGIRPINNVVDITNYIMILFGQPLHAFDQQKLGKEIVVRHAEEGEETVTLDDQKRILSQSDIVITDGKKVVAIAGVMGCANTSVTEATKDLVLESAVFRPLSVRKTSSRLGLRSEASIRFERGVDVNTSLEAVNYACYLLEKYADAKILDGSVHQGTKFIEDRIFSIPEDYISNYLGVKIPLSEINDIFLRLGFTSKIKNAEIIVAVPNRRLDITIREDLVEEVARIKGYDALNETLPLMNVNSVDTESQIVRAGIKRVLSEMGLREVITYSLIGESALNTFNYLFPEQYEPIRILNPMSEDRSVLRLGLVNSLIEVIKYNQARKIPNLSVFEVAKRYYLEEGNGVEEWCLAGALTGEFASTKWNGKVEKVDFYLVKGILETLFKKMEMDLKFQRITKECAQLHPYRSAEILNNGHVIGYLGAVHPKYAAENDLEETYVFEIMLTSFINKPETVTQFTTISRYPSVERDLALVVGEDVLAGDLINAVYSTDRKLIKNVEVFDLYRGENIEPGHISIALKITMEANETLTDDVISERIKKIVKSLEYRYHARLR